MVHENMVHEQSFLVDTNAWINDLDYIKQLDNVVVLAGVLRELDKLKGSSNNELAYRSRCATRYIKENRERMIFDMRDYDAENILGGSFENSYVDNRIIACLMENKRYTLVTNDVLLMLKAEGFGLPVLELSETADNDALDYSGVKELFLSSYNEEDNKLLAQIYSESNPLDMVQNEYLVIWNKDRPSIDHLGNVSYDCIDILRFDGKKLVKLKFKATEDRFMGKTSPINIKQRLAFDMLQNKQIKGAMLVGGAGSGKDYVIAAHMMQMLQREEIDKIVFVRNIQPLKESGEVGFLKGDLLQKMLTWVLPLADQIGGIEGLMMLIEKGKIEIQHFESIRGRSFNRCGVWVTEMQSMSAYHAKVLVSRIGEGSFLYLNGDIMQTDSDVRKVDSAINAMKKLKGNPMFAMVTLDKTERSDFAALSELL